MISVNYYLNSRHSSAAGGQEAYQRISKNSKVFRTGMTPNAARYKRDIKCKENTV